MFLIFGFDESLLDILLSELSEFSLSPEEFLLNLEQQLEDGELTESEAVQLIRDFNRR